MTASRLLAALLFAWLAIGFMIELNYINNRADARVAKARAIGDANTRQAESKWVACLRDDFFTIGTAIYRCTARKSELTTDQI